VQPKVEPVKKETPVPATIGKKDTKSAAPANKAPVKSAGPPRLSAPPTIRKEPPKLDPIPELVPPPGLDVPPLLVPPSLVTPPLTKEEPKKPEAKWNNYEVYTQGSAPESQDKNFLEGRMLTY
jgi:hypothetical protein